jgi:two-component system phosphate regulon response regulator PhoB
MSDYVLVVDDNPDVRTLIVDALSLFDIEGVVAVNGQEALRLVGDRLPTAIILDLMMPSMNGFGVITRLRQNAASRGIPIIVLSGLSDSRGGIRRLPGVVGVMCKGDFSLDRFRSLLDAAGLAA